MEEEEDNACVIKLFGSDDIEKAHPFEIGKREAELIYIVNKLNDEDEDEDEDEDQVKEATMENVGKDTLEKVVSFCRYYAANPDEAMQLEEFELPIQNFLLREIFPQWFADFVSHISAHDLFRLLAAAHYMGVAPLEKLVSVPVSILIAWYASKGELHKLFRVDEGKGRMNNKKRKSGNKDKVEQQLDELMQHNLARKQSSNQKTRWNMWRSI